MRSSIRWHLLAVLAVLCLTFGPLKVASASTGIPLHGVLHLTEDETALVGVLSGLGAVQLINAGPTNLMLVTADGSQLILVSAEVGVKGGLFQANLLILGGTGSLAGATGSFIMSIPLLNNALGIVNGVLILP